MILVSHLLVVDDEPITRQSLTDILRLEGYAVSSVPNGDEAVKYIQKNPVDLIVLDLRMPGMGGMDVMKAVSRISPETEIILLTAHGSMDSAVDALRYRVHDYLIKPASPSQILASIERGLARRSARVNLINQDSNERIDVLPSVIQFDDGTTLDFTQRTITSENKSVNLSATEAQILGLLIGNPGRVYSYQELVILLKGRDSTLEQAQSILRPVFSRLRKKIEAIPALKGKIKNIRNSGYSYAR